MKEDDLIALVTFALLAPIVLVVVVFFCVNVSTENQCLQLGYPGHKVSWTLGRYCIARVEQTDVVVPLAEARQKPRR